MLYHDCYIPKCCKTGMFRLSASKILQHTSLFLATFIMYTTEDLFHEYIVSSTFKHHFYVQSVIEHCCS